MLTFNIKTKKTKIKTKERGVSLYIAILISSLLLSIALGLNSLIINQLKIIRDLENSVIALQAADTGIEKALFCLYRPEEGCSECNTNIIPFDCQGFLGEASYEVRVVAAEPGSTFCPSSIFKFYCINSIGKFRDSRRAINASY